MTSTVDQTSVGWYVKGRPDPMLNLITYERVGRDCLKFHLFRLEVCSFRQSSDKFQGTQ